MTNTLDSINSRLDAKRKKILNLENIAIETIKNERGVVNTASMIP